MNTVASIALMVSLGVALVTQSCTHRPLDEVPVTPNVSFEKDIKPITSTVCISCHSSGALDWSQYHNAFVRRYSIYQRVVVSKDMPMGKFLDEKDRALFRDWVDQGGQK